MGKKVRELELEIEQLQQQLFAKQRVQSNLEAEVAVYHSKQNAIINALTEAQSSASRIIADAQARADALLGDAEESVRTKVASADAIVENADARANVIIENANKAAQSIISEAEEAVKAKRAELDAINLLISKAAECARDFAQEFAERLESAQVSAPSVTPSELPEEYKNPQQLMHTIYAIEGRDIPDEDPVHTDGAAQAMREPIAQTAPDDNPFDDDSVNVEERIWTVDEVTAGNASQGDNSEVGDDELDALLNDILKSDRN